MIIVRTRCDPATEYTYQWTELIIDEARKRNVRVVLVEGDDVNMHMDQHYQ